MKFVTKAAVLLGLVTGAAVSMVGGGAAAKGSVTCTETLTGSLPSVVVPEGATCVLREAVVTGNVSAGADTTLWVISSEVSGNISSVDGTFALLIGPESTGPSVVDGNVALIGTRSATGLAAYVCGTKVSGNLLLDGTEGAAVGGSRESGAACRDWGEGNVVDRNLTVNGTSGRFFRVADNIVGQNLNVSENTADFTARVWDNHATGKVNCFDNGPEFSALGNEGAKLNGQCQLD